MIVKSLSSAKTEKLAQRVQDICADLASIAPQSPVIHTAVQTLKDLGQQLLQGKPILRIASQDAENLETVTRYVCQDRPWVDAYDIQQITLSPHVLNPPITHSSPIQTHWFCDVWCLVTDHPDPCQWLLPPRADWPHVHAEILAPWVAKPSSTALEAFCQTIESLVKRKPEELLIKRVIAQSLDQLDAIMAALETERQHSAATIISTQAALKEVSQAIDLTEISQAEQALNTLQQQLALTFKELAASLDQPKEALLDPYYRYSLVHQIQAFTASLQPVVIRRGSSHYVQLAADHLHHTVDINLDLIQLCDNRLAQWTLEQWQFIYAGLVDRCVQPIDRALHRIPGDRSQRPSPLPMGHCLTFQGLMKDSIAGISCELYYKEVSILHHIMRQLRSQWMGLMFFFTFIGMLGGATNKRGMIQALVAPLYQLTDRPWLMVLILSGILCPIFFWLFSSHHTEGQVKLEDAADKLRKQLFDYYRKFADVSIDRVIKRLREALSQEKEQVQQQLQWATDYLTAHKVEAEKDQQSLKQQLQTLLSRQDNLIKAQEQVSKHRSRLA